MRYPTLDVIASWPKPNYVDPVGRGPALLAVELTVLPLALLCLALRMYVRIRLLRAPWWDDWLMLAAGLCCIGVTTAVILADQRYGWNLHVWDVPYGKLVQGRQVSIAGQTIFLFASGFGKLSILLSYLRIASRGSLFRRLTWASIVLVAACIVAFLVLLWTQCFPMASYWNLFDTARDCIPEAPPLMAQTISTVATDFIVYVLPMPTLYSLKLPFTQRLGLMVLFGFGSIVVIAGCMRTYWIHFVELETYDITWEGFNLWMWAAVEVNLGVICGCVPVLRPLIVKVFPRLAGTTRPGGATSASTRWTKSVQTIGSTAARKKRNTLGNMACSDADGYINLSKLEAGSASQSPLAPGVYSTVTAGPYQGPPERGTYSSDGSFELPQQMPTPPAPIVKSVQVQRQSVYYEHEDMPAHAEKGASWM